LIVLIMRLPLMRKSIENGVKAPADHRPLSPPEVLSGEPEVVEDSKIDSVPQLALARVNRSAGV